ncbi:serine/threonine-protein kinase [Chamaesiphon sp. VAR_48_metabat_135_sub]|uniref:serine/threonine protein kinase n=1 Tax=Chamaesiphon sp. VAR_48_metabat_135_sub TaxID=2964699 RepID=UPI00286CE679|nr:serine/threonine-protein kinase [Chamaesiphon sp. VAR_48_metabat_135_sub]
MVEDRFSNKNSASTDESFAQIVYAKVKSNGKTELVPLKLHVDGSWEPLDPAMFAAPATSGGKILLANRYELQRILGQGGFGRTYLTLDRYRFNEPCVVKEFLPQHHGDYEAQKSRELFEREAKILHQIDRAQIPKFFACFEEDEKLFLVQEYIKGQTYSSLLRDRQQQGQTFSESEIIKWLKDLLPVLSYLHDRQIVHRDISLDNIMLQEGTHLPVLIDFGIGRSAIVQGRSQDIHGTPISYPTQQSIVGKVGYAPYEQIWLGQSFPSSDLYSLAVTAVVMLTGIEPQSLTDRSSLKSKWQLHTSVSDGLVKILNRMLQDLPANRYQSAAAVLTDVERLTINPQTQLSQPVATPLPITTLTAVPTSPQLEMPTINNLTPEFIARCEKELINYIGPIGKFLVKTTLTKHPNLSSADFITLLAQHIPQPVQANEFRNSFR